jgi:protein-disulfide isomerase
MPKTESTGASPKFRLALLPLFSVVGASAAIYLARHYYELRSGTAGFKSLCNISETMDCNAVTSSRFAEIMPGLPLASFAAGWFVALIILGLMARVKDWRREAVLVSSVMNGFGSLYSVALLVVMTLVIHKFCLFCLVIDGVNFALFAVSISLLNDSRAGSVLAGARWSKIQTNALIVLGTMAVLVVILRPSADIIPADTRSEIDTAVRAILDSSPVEIKTPPDAAILGNAVAAITIHEFSDFQCPFCKRGAVMMNQLLARYPGKIRVIFMPFPLDNACNRIITHPMHPYSCELARAAYCASKDSKFQPVYEKIFEDQEFLTADSAKKIPADLGLDAAKLKTCMDGEDAKKFVSNTIEEGLKFKVDSTPTFFINGHKIDVSLPMEAWDELIAGVK